MNSVYLTHNRRRLTITQWIRELGANPNTVWGRWKRGARDFKTLFAADDLPGRRRMITHAGKTQSIADWARDAGLSRQRMQKRLETHSIAEALNCGKLKHT